LNGICHTTNPYHVVSCLEYSLIPFLFFFFLFFLLIIFFFFFFFFFFSQVSAVTDQTGMLEIGGNPGDFDDDEGGGLVS
jgi:hypothetical protein